MAADPEFLEPMGFQPGNDPAFASDEQMAMLLGFESSAAPQPGAEIFVPGLEHQMPQPNAVNFGSSERSIAEVVYTFGYVAAQLAHQRRLLEYSPSRDTGFDPFAPFYPPLMREAVEAVHNAVRLQNGRIRINAMGGHILNLVLAYGARPDTRLFDMHNALGAGAHAIENIDAIHAEREAFERAMAEEARILTAPAMATPGTADAPFILNDAPAARTETVTPRQILAAYEDGVDGYDTKTRKVDLRQFPAALRLVAIQNVVAAHLDSLGELPEDEKLYTVEEAAQLLTAPGFDKKRGVIQLLGDVVFNPRTGLMSVTGKSSLDVRFNVPGLTRRVVYAALALIAEAEQQPIPAPHFAFAEPTEREPVPSAEPTTEQTVAQETDGTVVPITLNYEAARLRFIDRLAALLDGNLPDEETIQALYKAIASSDVTNDPAIVGNLFKYNGSIGRTDTFNWVAQLRDEMRTWSSSRSPRQKRRMISPGSPADRPTFAARTGARQRNSSARVRVEQPPRRRSRD